LGDIGKDLVEFVDYFLLVGDIFQNRSQKDDTRVEGQKSGKGDNPRVVGITLFEKILQKFPKNDQEQ